MEIVKLYLEHSLDTMNAVTAFSVVQSIAFTYWSQSKDFMQNIRHGGHVAGIIFLVLFSALYAGALWVTTEDQLALLAHLQDIPAGDGVKVPVTVSDLEQTAWTALRWRVAVVCIFNLIAAIGLLRYFQGRYPRKWGGNDE
jgi:hypothetical protein